MAAFVLVKAGKVQRLELGPTALFENAVLAWRKRVVNSESADEKAAGLLRKRLWLPLEKAVGGAKTVLLVPDGPLYALPFAALPGSKRGTYLIEELSVVQLPSARLLLELQGVKALHGEGLLAVGGLDYGRGGPWRTLAGTALETADLARRYRVRFSDTRAPQMLVGQRGSRSALLKALSGKERWQYLHLACHGFFAPPESYTSRGDGGAFAEQRAELTFRRNPLLLSGLVLAGANADPAGVLTAEEVTTLDLRGCELVVLSACQTGLGRVAGGEGVLGLQRALHLAGARNVVTSLWNVSDPATSVLMEEFYRRLWSKEKLSRLEALRQAQLFVLGHPEVVRARAKELRKRVGAGVALRGEEKEALVVVRGRPTSGKRSPPAWWAAFVLSGRP
jgi:CHAT domain-containing protein